MPSLDLQISEAEAQNLVRVLRHRQWAGENDISLVLWLVGQFNITPIDAASLYSNFQSGFNFGLDPILDSTDDDWSPTVPSPQNLIHQAAFELGRTSRDAVRKRQDAWERRFFYVGIMMAIPCVLQGVGIVNFPLAFLCSSVGGLIAGAFICSNPVVAGIGGGAITGAISSLALFGYAKIRYRPSGFEVALLLALAAMPGVIAGVLVKDLHRRLRWRSQVAVMRRRSQFASHVDLRFPDKLKPNWRAGFWLLAMLPIGFWLLLTNSIRRFVSRLFGRPRVLR